MGDGVGLVCLVLSSGSVFTGCLPKPTGGTQSIGAPSSRGVARIFYMGGPIFDNDEYHYCMDSLYF